MAAIPIAVLLCGCSSDGGAGGETTCEEYLSISEGMSIEEQLDSAGSDGGGEERAILEKALRDNGLDDEPGNVATAMGQVLEFCGPDGTGTRRNLQKPIEGAIR